MKRLSISLACAFVLIFTSCGPASSTSSVPVATATTQPNKQIILVPTSTPVPAPTSTLVPTDMVAIERLFKILAFQAAIEDGMRKTAADIQAKKSDGNYSLSEGMNGFGQIMALGIMSKATGDALKYDYPANLTPFVEIAQKQQDDLSSILRRWFDKEISSADIPGLLQTSNATETIKSYVTAMQKFGLDQARIEKIIKDITESMKSLDKTGDTPTPTP